ncbi:MAG: hypothetical protein AABY26_03015 [Nanoarchaeota archaeon]
MINKKYIIGFALMLLVFLLVACVKVPASSNSASSADIAVPNASPEKPVSGSPLTGAAIGVPYEDKEVPIIISLGGPKYDPEVFSFIEKAKNVDNYRYVFKSQVQDSSTGLLLEEAFYTVLIRVDKAKKVYLEPKYRGEGVYYNEVLLDLKEKKALGTCTQSGVVCEDDWKKAYSLDYDAQKITITPLGLMLEMPTNARIIGGGMYDARRVTEIEYPRADGSTERLYVDDFYAIPLERRIFKLTEDYEEIILIKQTFTPLSVGSGTVKSSEVNLPEDYKQIE